MKALVQTVVDDTYGGLWCAPPVPIGDADWSLAWIAIAGDRIAGMVLTSTEWIDDLWVLPEYRSCGLGRRLLAQAEREIAHRGFRTLRLRVVRSNVRAISFYKNQGWHEIREFQHETFAVPMLEMSKEV